MSIHVKQGPTGTSPRANDSTTTLPRTLRSDPTTFVFVLVLHAQSIGKTRAKRDVSS